MTERKKVQLVSEDSAILKIREARLQRRKEFHAVSITRALKLGEEFSSPLIQVGANEVHFQHRKPKRQYACLEWVFNF